MPATQLRRSVAPWNGGSGFFPKDNAEALTAIERGTAARLEPCRSGIATARQVLARLGIGSKPDGDTKSRLLQSCRNHFPERTLAWLDAVFVLGQDGAKFPPLLGTGGNDGRLDFTNNFMQRLTTVMDPATGAPTGDSARWPRDGDDAIPLVPSILHRAMNGDGASASALAARRLRASGQAPLVNTLPISGEVARRTAAAVLFPIAGRDFRLLERMILKPQNQQVN